MDTPGPLPVPAFSRHSCQSASPQTLQALRLREGLTPVVWGLSLAPGTEPFSHLTLATMANVKRMTKDHDESWFGAQRLIRFMDQKETQVRSLSMTSVRAQSTMETKLSLTVLGLVSKQNQVHSECVIKGQDSVYDRDQGSVCY